MSKTLTAHATRSGEWWAIEVPEIPGLFTQAKRLDQIEPVVAEAASDLSGDPAESFLVEVTATLEDRKVKTLADAAIEARQELSEAQERASAASHDAVSALRDQGLTVRDVASILGITPQRVSQISADKKIAV